MERGWCNEHAQNILGPMLTGKTAETCDQACILEERCVEFAIGRSDGTNSGDCYLYKEPCTKKSDFNYD